MEEERKNQIKAFREGMKKSLKDLKEKFFNLPLSGVLEVIQKSCADHGGTPFPDGRICRPVSGEETA